MGHVLSDLGRPEEALGRLSRRAAAQARPAGSVQQHGSGAAAGGSAGGGCRRTAPGGEARAARCAGAGKSGRRAEGTGAAGGSRGVLPRRAAPASRRPGAARQPGDRAAAGRPVRHRVGGIRVAIPRRRCTGAAMHPAALEWRGVGRPHAADPRRAGDRRYHPVLPLRDDGGRTGPGGVRGAAGPAPPDARPPGTDRRGGRRAAGVRSVVPAAQPAASVWDAGAGPAVSDGRCRPGRRLARPDRHARPADRHRLAGQSRQRRRTRPLDPARGSSCRWPRCRACG